MRTIGKMVRLAIGGTALMLLALPGVPAAAEHGGMSGIPHGGSQGAQAPLPGERIFAGKVGSWTAEARLIDLKAQMEQSGVSAATAARFGGRRHLMLFLTDPKTGKALAGAMGTVVVTGPDKASSSKVSLVVMGEHIGADVAMPTPGKYAFQAEVEAGGRKGSASFSCTVK